MESRDTVQALIKKRDMELIGAITHKDGKSFDALQKMHSATVCGRKPILLFKALQRRLPNIAPGQLLAYKTSYDVTQSDPLHSVSYAAIVFDRYFSAQDEKKMITYARHIIDRACDGKMHTADIPPLDIVHAQERRGIFVTLRDKKTKALRGCMGSIFPRDDLTTALYMAAQNAAFHDPRFSPVTCAELSDVYIEVSILTPPYPVPSYTNIKIGVDGIVLSHGDKSAVFLPKVATEQNWDLKTTLEFLARKAGLAAHEWKNDKTKFRVFQAIDFSELSH